MTIQGVSIKGLIDQSITVLTKPSVATFEEFERRGGQREGTIYVAVAAAIGAVVTLIFGLFSGIVPAIIGAVIAFLSPIISFFILGFLIFFIGKQFGGTGTQDEVFYSISLYMAPILAVSNAVSAIPILGCLALPLTLVLSLYSIYLGYLAIRASMNLESNKAIITMVIVFVVQLIIAGILGGIVGAAAIGSGALNQ